MGAESVPMLLRLSDSGYTISLRDHLRRVGCVVVERGPAELQVVVDAPSSGQARRELEVYVGTWRATHAGVDVRMLED
jgi:hypothetical protein